MWLPLSPFQTGELSEMAESVAELRAQAAHARALANAVYDEGLKASLLEAAVQLDEEANRLEGDGPTVADEPKPE